MESNELRVGNWVYNDENNPVKLVVIETADFCEWNGSDSQYMFIEDGGYKYSSINPIALTSDILDKIGFDTDVNGDMAFEIGARMWIWFNKGNPAEMDLIQDGKNISFKCSHVKYLHQLQNLYFALNNKELEISL